jgi:hypothetical protein
VPNVAAKNVGDKKKVFSRELLMLNADEQAKN